MRGWGYSEAAGTDHLASFLIGFLAFLLLGGGPGGHLGPSSDVAVVQGKGALRGEAGEPSGLLAELRAAQRRFERIRRQHLRRVPYVSGPCDEIIGRFCLWNDEEDWEPPPESPAVTKARRELLVRLRTAQRELPGNGWITGQRVRYLVEAGDTAGAAAAAGACRSDEPGWCAALSGFAYHAAGDFVRADSAFRTALAGMGPEERCAWADLRRLLQGRARRAYVKPPCGERTEFEARFWWLADPLYLVPGNERRTEHYARHVMDRLQEDAASGFGLPWADDLREILIRYGWPAGWEATLGRPGLIRGEPHLVAHDPPGTRQFLPIDRWLVRRGGVEEIPAEMWNLDPRRAHSHYAHPLAREFGRLEHQVARFRRGDTAVVMVAMVASPDTPPGCEVAERALVLSAGPGGPTVVSRESGPGDRGALTAAFPAPGDGVLLGAEMLCRSAGRAARVRYGLELRRLFRSPAVSDLLLGRTTAGEPPTLQAASTGARARLHLRPGERVPVYWEAYGVDPGVSATVSLGLTRAPRSALRKAAERLRIARRHPSVSLVWREASPESGPWRRSVAFNVPEDLSRGVYRLEVVISLPGTLPLRTSRVVEVGGR
ncbi:MAG: hypothetical protein ACE5HP_01725 [Gemmatimonadota bacterium]